MGISSQKEKLTERVSVSSSTGGFLQHSTAEEKQWKVQGSKKIFNYFYRLGFVCSAHLQPAGGATTAVKPDREERELSFVKTLTTTVNDGGAAH